MGEPITISRRTAPSPAPQPRARAPRTNYGKANPQQVKLNSLRYLKRLRATPLPQKNHWGWQLAYQIAKLVKSMNLNIRDMTMNGGKAGCHWPETFPVAKLTTKARIGCDTIYKRNTRAAINVEVRPLAGTSISRVYRLWIHYNKLVKHKYIGVIPVYNAGIYGRIGPNMNRMGPMCRYLQLGPFVGGPDCAAFERYFHIPLHGAIPQNWSSATGNVDFFLLPPFGVRRTISDQILGAWGVNPHAYPKGITPGTFPSNFAQLIQLLSTMHASRVTHINLNGPYAQTGMKPHIDWLDMHDLQGAIVTRPGTINIPNIGSITLARGMRIDLKATKTSFAITIHKPAFKELRIPVGKTSVAARNIQAHTIHIVMPAIADLRSGKRTMSDTKVKVTGLTIPHLAIGNLAFGRTRSVSGAKLKLQSGKMTMGKVNGLFSTTLAGHFDVTINRIEARNLALASGLMISGALHNVHVRGPAHVTFNKNSWDIRGGVLAGHPGTKLTLTAKLVGGRVVYKPVGHKPRGRGYTTDLHISDKLVIDDLLHMSYRLAKPGTQQGSLFNLALGGLAINDLTISGQMGIAKLGRVVFSQLTGILSVASARIAANGARGKSVLEGILLDVRERKGQRKRCKIMIPRASLAAGKVQIGDHAGKRFAIDCLINTPNGFTHLKTGNR